MYRDDFDPAGFVDRNSEDVYSKQQTWLFAKTGYLEQCHINKILLKALQEYDINSARVLTDKEYNSVEPIKIYSFDASGRITQVIDTRYSNTDSFEYDKYGRLTKISTHYKDVINWHEDVITLNAEGKPVRVETVQHRFEDALKQSSSKSKNKSNKYLDYGDTYCYDERGNMVAHQMNNGNTAKWMDYFVYDSLDNMILEGRCNGYNGDNSSCECKGFHASQGYEYDEQHHLIRKYSIGDWKPSGWDYYYQYDSAGREIEYKHYDVRDTQRTFDRHIQTTYDSAGRMVKKEALLGSFKVNEAIFNDTRKAILEECSYDEHGNLSEHVVYQTEDEIFKLVRYQYSYDQHGNWIKRVRFEGDNEKSMTVTEILERQIQYY